MNALDEGDSKEAARRLEDSIGRLSPEEQAAFRRYKETARASAMRTAAAAIMARNFSHNLGNFAILV